MWRIDSTLGTAKSFVQSSFGLEAGSKIISHSCALVTELAGRTLTGKGRVYLTSDALCFSTDAMAIVSAVNVRTSHRKHFKIVIPISKCIGINQIVHLRKPPKTPHLGVELVFADGLGFKAALANFTSASAVADVSGFLRDAIPAPSHAVDSEIRWNVADTSFTDIQAASGRLDALFPPLIHMDATFFPHDEPALYGPSETTLLASLEEIATAEVAARALATQKGLTHWVKMIDECSERVAVARECVGPLVTAAAERDVDAARRGNGYWSLLQVLSCVSAKIEKVLKDFIHESQSISFPVKQSSLSTRLLRHTGYLDQLNNMLREAVSMATLTSSLPFTASTPLPLSPLHLHRGAEGTEMMERLLNMHNEYFYGKNICLPFSSMMKHALVMIVASGTSFYRGFGDSTGAAAIAGETAGSVGGNSETSESSLLPNKKKNNFFGSVSNFVVGGLKALSATATYAVAPSQLGHDIFAQQKTLDIATAKKFWNLTENAVIANMYPAVTTPSLKHNEIITVATSTQTIPRLDGSVLTVPPPSPAGVNIRFLSDSSVWDRNANPESVFGPSLSHLEAVSPSLVIHIHGGGFIAHSSSSHLVYSQHWASKLQCPFISIDYSLAPEAQYPVASEECFSVYVWALNNMHLLGCKGVNIAIVGDSAGANLVMSTTLRAIDAGIRLPTGIVLAYGVFNCNFSPSPSRSLALMDPLLTAGALKLCMKAYVPDDEDTEQPYLSPLFASTDQLMQLPEVFIIASALDPLLDDSVQLARRLKSIGHPRTQIRILNGISHGFLNLRPIPDENIDNACGACLYALQHVVRQDFHAFSSLIQPATPHLAQ